MDDNFREKFIEICEENDETIIQYLNASLSSGEFTSFEEIGFYYWSISSCFARMKDAEKLYENHIKFAEHVSKSDNPCYLFWTVLDPLQRFVLESGGYSDFWWDLYKNAAEKNADGECIWEEFHAHKAALMTRAGIVHDIENAEFALRAYRDFFSSTVGYEHNRFFGAMYKLFLCRAHGKRLPRAFVFYKKFLLDVAEFYHPDEEFLIGEWKRFTSPLTVEKQARIMLRYAINTAFNQGADSDAKRLYYIAYDFGLPRDSYIEKRLGEKFDP